MKKLVLSLSSLVIASSLAVAPVFAEYAQSWSKSSIAGGGFEGSSYFYIEKKSTVTIGVDQGPSDTKLRYTLCSTNKCTTSRELSGSQQSAKLTWTDVLPGGAYYIAIENLSTKESWSYGNVYVTANGD
ncbi:hypothetical protein [Paenibacillus oleatilyticus]|uniref:Uncharacterized protein n=1 Tax=Paenibacillus oleatilyticus TaxID=2594886 RepID=A0ABV4V6R2_9BACL